MFVLSGSSDLLPQHLEKEETLLFKILSQNGYPDWFIHKHSSVRSNEVISTAPKKPVYFGLQYLGENSVTEARSLIRTISSSYPHLKIIPYYKTRRLTNNGTKDPIPPTYKPFVIYGVAFLRVTNSGGAP